jgi:sialate O-acetylesterase
MARSRAILLVALLLPPAAAQVQIRLPAVIGDGMVLQRESEVWIWGWTEPGEIVHVRANWPNGPVGGARSEEDGVWRFPLSTPPAGGPYTITLTDFEGRSVELNDVLVGEVWLCSGQSNMEMPVGDVGGGYRGVKNSAQELAAANHPRIRLFNVVNATSMVPLRDCKGSWRSCSPESVREFSGTAYFFGRALHEALDVPIGLIEADWGGTPADAWTSEQGLRAIPDYAESVAELAQARAEAASSRPASRPAPKPGTPGVLFNGMIAPLVPYSIRGAIWYQGESNRARAARYRLLFPAMIADWRRAFGRGDFPFYFVQIAPFDYKDPPERSTALREAQLATLAVPNTGMVVTTDIGNPTDIHPANKQEVGRRLSLWALAKTYGRTNVVCSGPLYRSMKVEGGAIRVSFDYAGGGLTSGGKPLTHFEIAGDDRKFVPAEASIDGATVLVSSPAVAHPVAVRFASGNAPEPNLANQEGLPASPFRTDDWPLGIEGAGSRKI